MQRAIVSLLVLTGWTSTACNRTGVAGSGTVKSESRPVAAFDEIDFGAAGALEVTIGQPQSLTVTCDDNILPLIETKVVDHRLTVRPVEQIHDFDLVIKATVADLKRLDLDGAASVTATDLENDRLDIAASGAASLSLAGRTAHLDLDLSGAGSIDAEQLEARDVRIALSGASSAHVHATETLNASISGVGSVVYTGDPEVTQAISGIGSISRKGG